MRRQKLVRIVLVVGVLVTLVGILAYAVLDASAQGTRITYGETSEDEIAGTGEEDSWRFEGISGDVITVRVARSTGNLVPAVALTDPAGGLMVQLEWPQTGPPEIVVTTRLYTNGEHTLRVTGQDGTTGAYTITLELQQAGQPAASGAGILAYGQAVSGTITDTTFREFWSFRGTQGDIIDALMTASTGDLDAFLTLNGPDGTTLIEADSGGVGQDAALFAVQLPASGTYTLVARRAGGNFGESGTTQGQYTLALTLRSAGDEDTPVIPAELTPGAEMRGRLTADAPGAFFSIAAEGVLALALDMADPVRMGTISVMTPEQALLGVYTGIAPLRAAVNTAGLESVWVEVSAANVRENAPVDFALKAFRLATATRTSRPLLYGQPREVAGVAGHPESWHFNGKTGELVDIQLESFAPVSEGRLHVFAPDGTLLIDRAVYSAGKQSLVLAQDGPYEITIDPTIAAAGYQIAVHRTGMSGLAFDQLAAPVTQGLLTITSNRVSADLSPGDSHAWTLDVLEPLTWSFRLEQTGANAPLALAIEAPSGEWVAFATTDRLANATSLQATLDKTGRYRAVVFDPTGKTANAYTLMAEPGGGGWLATGQTYKGVLTPQRPVMLWEMQGVAGSVLSLRTEMLAGETRPDVQIIGPDGLQVTPLATEDVALPMTALMRESGRYRVIVSAASVGSRVAYRMTVEITLPDGTVSALAPIKSATVPALFVTDLAPVPPANRVSPSDRITLPIMFNQATLASAPSINQENLVRGDVGPGEQVQVWALAVNAGQLLNLTAIAVENNNHPDMALLDSEGRVLAEQYQQDSSACRLMQRVSNGGQYYVVVRLENGGRYTLWAETLAALDENLPQVVPGQTLIYGQTITGTLNQPEERDHFVFYGQANDVIQVRARTTRGNLRPQITLLNRDETVLASATTDEELLGASLTNIRLPGDGAYRLDIAPQDERTPGTGFYTLHVSLVQAGSDGQITGGLLLDRHVSALSGANGMHRWLFDAEAGEQISIRVEPLTNGRPTPVQLQLADTGGHVFLQQDTRLGQGALVISDVLLPRAGVYQAIVSGGQRGPGLYRISIEHNQGHLQDIESAIEYGVTEGKVLTPENFLDVWTLAGSRGDVISLLARPVRGDAALITLQLRTRNGDVLATVGDDGSGMGARVDSLTLPEDGHYSIIVGNIDNEFSGQTAYVLTARLENTSARSIGGLMGYGQTVEGRFMVGDLTDTWLFEGHQGDLVTAIVTGDDAGLTPAVELVSTDWHIANQTGQAEVLAGAQVLSGEAGQLQLTLPVTGTYALTIYDPSGTGGRYQLQLIGQVALENGAATIVPGLPEDGQLGFASEPDTWQVDGRANTNLTVTVSPDNRASFAPVVQIVAPDGTILGSETGISGQQVRIEKLPLPVSGTYQVLVAASDQKPGGRYTLELAETMPDSPEIPLTSYGRVERGLLGAETPAQRWQFEGAPGDVIRIRAETTSNDLDPVVRLYDPGGELLATGDDGTGLDAVIGHTLPAEGVYTVEVARYGAEWGITNGNFMLVVERVYQVAPVGTIRQVAYGDRVAGTTDTIRPVDRWWFVGEQGDIIWAKIQFPVDDAPLLLSLLDPGENVLASGERDRGDVVIDSFLLPASGLYALEVQRPGDARAVHSPYTLDLALVDAADELKTEGGLLALGETITAQFVTAPATHVWLFDGRIDQPIALTLVRLAGELRAQVTLLGPDGAVVFTATPPAGATNQFSTGSLNLPLDGLYTLLVAAEQPGMAYRLTLRAAEPIEVAPMMLQPLQDAFGILDDLHPRYEWQLEAEAGETISLRVAALTGDLRPELMLWGPAGVPLVEGIESDGQVSISGYIAPQSGLYTIAVGRVGGPMGPSSGNFRLMVRHESISRRAALAQDVAFGQPIRGTIDNDEPGLYAFQGLTGDLVDISLHVENTESTPSLLVEFENGRTVQVPVEMTDGEAIITTFALPEAARYVLVVTGEEGSVYSLIVARREQTLDMPTEAVVRALSRGQALAEGITDPAEPTYWQFEATAGEVLTFEIDTTGSGLRADMALYGPDGFLGQVVQAPEERVTALGPLRLPEDGNYTLVVAPWLGSASGSTGRYTVRVDIAGPGISGSEGGHIPVRGQVVTGGLILEDARDVWTFEGQAGELVSIRAEQTYGDGSLTLRLLDLDGETLATGRASIAFVGVEIQTALLPAQGTYQIEIEGQGTDGAALEYRLAVVQVQTPLLASINTARGITPAVPTGGILAADEDFRAWVFYGQAGERVRATVDMLDSMYAPACYLVGPDGTILVADAVLVAGNAAVLPETRLPATGFYGLVVGRSPLATVERAIMEFVITLEKLPGGAVNQGSLQNEAVASLAGAAPVHTWTFAPQQSGEYAIEVTGLAPGFRPDLAVLSAGGQVLGTGEPFSTDSERAVVRLVGGRAYTLVVSGGPNGANGHHYRLRVIPASTLASGGALEPGAINVGRLNNEHLADEWRFEGIASQEVTVQVMLISGDLVPQITLYDTMGEMLAAQVTEEEDGTLRVTAQLPADGSYRVLVSREGEAAGQSAGDYTITLTMQPEQE